MNAFASQLADWRKEKPMYWVKAASVLVCVAAGVAAVYLFWQNRESEKVGANGLTALAIGTLATLMTLIYSLKSESKETEFLTIYTVEKKTKLPFVPPDHPWVGLYTERQIFRPVADRVEECRVSRSDLFKNPDDMGTEIYRGVVLCNMFDVLATTFGQHWNPKIRRFQIPLHTTLSYIGPSDKTDAANEFISMSRFQGFFPKSMPWKVAVDDTLQRFAVPPMTMITSSDDGATQELTLENKFVVIHISSTFAFAMAGSGGLKELLSTNDSENEKYCIIGFVIKVRAEFNQWRSGHPDTEAQKQWVDTIISELRQKMDSQELWKELRETYVLRLRVASPTK